MMLRPFSTNLRRPVRLALGLLLLASHAGTSAKADEKEKDVRDQVSPEQARFFEARVRPLLAEHCFKCHGKKKSKGGVRLDSLSAMLAGGESGPAIVPGQPEDSLLIEAVRYEGYEMPPSGPLEDHQVEVLETWVRMGAPWPGADLTAKGTRNRNTETFTEEDRSWWAIQPVGPTELPQGKVNQWERNEIDRFISRRATANKVSPAPEATREELIRRLTFDLTGLPPSPEQIESFLSDPSPDAYEALVDRLLESPEYGERFARHWLDLVRYADTDGYRADHVRPDAWRYRDYVIDSLNEDKPFDRFLQEQVAGDELFPDDPNAHIATGFLTHGIYEYNSRDVAGQWEIILNEMTDTVGDVFLGVGMQCSRCHDHKFDPLLQRDYFALRAYLEPVMIDVTGVCASPEEIEAYDKADSEWQEASREVREQLATLEAPYRAKAKESAVIKFPESIQAMYNTPREEQTAREKQYSVLVERQVEFEYDRMDAKFSKEDKEKILALRRELQTFDHLKPKPLAKAQMVTSTGETAPPTIIPKKKIAVNPGSPQILSPGPSGQPRLARPGESPKSESLLPGHGRRADLARWLSDPGNPLSTRVIVNRIWQWHFGRGLAPNASDFGFLGGPPSHPELLDWLTSEFVDGGWKMKPLHRLIVTSATYRQSSRHPDSERLMVVDPRNQWYWRSDVRRLDAEQIRDSVLAVSGHLDRARGGPAASDDKHRRSIYTAVKRNSRNPLLDAFDLPLFFASTASRDTTTNPLQSLMLINSQSMLDHAEQLAKRSTSPSPSESVSLLWQSVYGRRPSDDELHRAEAFLNEQASRYTDQSNLDDDKVQTSTLPYRETAAVVIKPDGKNTLRASSHSALLADEFTVEAVFQISSIYESGAVRSIVSTWSGQSGEAGWTFGVTGKGSRRKPQTLVLHAFGSDGKRPVTEAAVFSDQHVKLGIPYYAAAVVRPAHEDSPGSITFYLKDLSDEEQPTSVATMDLDLISGLSGKGDVAVGGRTAGSSSVFDGLVDDVRLSRGALGESDLLLSSEEVSSSTIAYWRFEPAAGLDKDLSESQIHLGTGKAHDPMGSPQGRALSDLCHVLLNSSEFLYVR